MYVPSKFTAGSQSPPGDHHRYQSRHSAVRCCGHRQIAGTSAAAESLRTAVPCALHAAGSVVGRVERQADNNVDVLINIVAVEDVDPAIGRIRANNGRNYARNRFDFRAPGHGGGDGCAGDRRPCVALLDTPINAPDESAVLRSAA